MGSAVKKALEDSGHEVRTVSIDRRGDLLADLTDADSLRTVFENAGTFDAVACAAGDVLPAPLEQTTDEQWAKSFATKAMGQINVVRTALPFIADNGSFTLVSGILPRPAHRRWCDRRHDQSSRRRIRARRCLRAPSWDPHQLRQRDRAGGVHRLPRAVPRIHPGPSGGGGACVPASPSDPINGRVIKLHKTVS
jgi:NAD(P)-dependent dehydrogenase (short-subunit alcohol dehydrogenase family)